jgi:hypothetical protein
MRQPISNIAAASRSTGPRKGRERSGITVSVDRSFDAFLLESFLRQKPTWIGVFGTRMQK